MQDLSRAQPRSARPRVQHRKRIRQTLQVRELGAGAKAEPAGVEIRSDGKPFLPPEEWFAVGVSQAVTASEEQVRVDEFREGLLLSAPQAKIAEAAALV